MNLDVIKREKKCVCCGLPLEKNRRKYCSKECREGFEFRLKWFNNLLRAINVRYATFSFNTHYLFLNILPYDSEDVYSYFFSRSYGKKPIYDMEKMVFLLGQIWWDNLKFFGNKDVAKREVLNRGRKKIVGKEVISPMQKMILSGISNELRLLKINKKDLTSAEDPYLVVKKAYKKALFETHPDMGGDERAFMRVFNSYQKILLWLKYPTIGKQKGVVGFWSYEAQKENWNSPL